MVGKVFISYRRDDSRYQARMVYAAFTQVVPREHVFMDIDSIPLGADFRKILRGWVDQCDVLLALIGPTWASVTDPRSGQPRLMNPADFVRIEIAEALARDIPVVPVLLDGAPMPDPAKLPDDLKDLVYRHAEFVKFENFDDDVARLIRKLRPAPAQLVVPAPASAPPKDRIKVDALTTHGVSDGWFKPGAGKTEWFKDHAHGPEMVVVPTGSFTMGSPESEPEREPWLKGSESPQRQITFRKPFAVGRHAVTRGQFAAFFNNTGYKTEGGAFGWTGTEWKHDPKYSWRNPGFAQDDSHPVVCVNWDDAKAYVQWLSEQTGTPYKLLSEAEWEYVTRAGTTTPFWWGSAITPKQANYDGNFTYAGGGSKGEYRQATAPAGSFDANPWGLFNVHGNVWEWCEDVWHDSLNGIPEDGAPRMEGDPSRRVLRGGSWGSIPQYLRSAYRGGSSSGDRGNGIGFRVGRTF
ncbi:MAG: SUMF1/EgtB/PvdO family nonheme iron enzyme [Hyphomicrobiaceae bacterium]|nr:SUMF1/EgtB/PvdO family nonheme iron enzyme [Hyphomicrobiaceae bacterium]